MLLSMTEGGQMLPALGKTVFLLAYPGRDAGLYGGVAERLKAPSLHLGAGVQSTCRGFESRSLRQSLEGN